MDQINLSPEYSIIELMTPPEFVGKSLLEAGLRKEYGVNVLAIRRGKEILISPGARQAIHEGDILVAIGRNDQLKRIESDF